MNVFFLPCILALGALVSGCASLIEGSAQAVNIDTNPRIQGTCTVQNDRGLWNVSALPATLEVKRSRSELRIRCEGMGMKGIAGVASKTASWSYGNIATAGLGAGVDGATGALYQYPSTIVVHMMADSAAQGAAPPLPPMMQQGYAPAPVAPFGTMPPPPVAPGSPPPLNAYPNQPYPAQGTQPLPPQGYIPPPQGYIPPQAAPAPPPASGTYPAYPGIAPAQGQAAVPAPR